MKHTPSTVGRPFEPAERQTTSQGSTMVSPVEHGTVGCFHLWLGSVGGAGSIGISGWGLRPCVWKSSAGLCACALICEHLLENIIIYDFLNDIA